MHPPRGFLAEIEAALRLFRGGTALLERSRAEIDQVGFPAPPAVAPTARSAWWFASAGRESLILDRAALETALAALPVAVACDGPDALGLLLNIGITTIGELRSRPREGVARRCGQALLDRLERALGETSEPRDFFVPPPRFAAKLELPGLARITTPSDTPPIKWLWISSQLRQKSSGVCSLANCRQA